MESSQEYVAGREPVSSCRSSFFNCREPASREQARSRRDNASSSGPLKRHRKVVRLPCFVLLQMFARESCLRNSNRSVWNHRVLCDFIPNCSTTQRDRTTGASNGSSRRHQKGYLLYPERFKNLRNTDTRRQERDDFTSASSASLSPIRDARAAAHASDAA
jgi:hypothetical protein